MSDCLRPAHAGQKRQVTIAQLFRKNSLSSFSPCFVLKYLFLALRSWRPCLLSLFLQRVRFRGHRWVSDRAAAGDPRQGSANVPVFQISGPSYKNLRPKLFFIRFGLDEKQEGLRAHLTLSFHKMRRDGRFSCKLNKMKNFTPKTAFENHKTFTQDFQCMKKIIQRNLVQVLSVREKF